MLKIKSLELKYLLLFFGSFFIIVALLNIEKEYKINNYLEKKSVEVEGKYKSIYNQYKQLADSIFLLNIKQPEIIDIFKDAHKSDEKTQDIIRNNLKNKLENIYGTMKKFDLKQLHFHLPDNRSFLRMHKVKKFGDNLTNIRETVKYVNKHKIKIDSFEEGRIYNGFRFVYPLFHNNIHIGSVEISFSTLAFHLAYKKDYDGASNFLISKKVVENKVYESEQKNYISSPFKEFYFEKSVITSLEKDSFKIRHNPSYKIVEYFKKKVHEGQIYSIYDDKTQTLKTFIPIFNSVKKEMVAVFTIIDFNDKYVNNKRKNFYAICSMAFIFLMLIFYFIYKNSFYNFQLNLLNKDLKEKVKETNKSKLVAENALLSKSEFLANISHEIRTPMNAIIGLTFLLDQTKLEPKQSEYIQKIDSAAKHLLGLINDILDYSKIEAGKMNLEYSEFDFNHILENISDMFLFKLQDKNLELLYDIDPKMPKGLIGDSLRLSQILINIIGNAIKFTQKGSIVLKTNLISQDKDAVKIEFVVSDTGIGMTKEQLKTIFSTYSQADSSTTRKFGGTGLGLAISKYLINQMQGDISVKSEYGKGSVFSFSVYLQTQQKEQFFDFYKSHNLKVLLVDDNEKESKIIKRILRTFHYKVISVQDPLEGFELIQKEDKNSSSFDLILTDYSMPKITGVELIEKIREDKNLNKQPRIILITSWNKEKIEEKLKNSDVDKILSKPFSASSLFNAIIAVSKEDKQSVKVFQKEKNKNYKTYIPKIEGAHILLVEDNLQNQEIAIEYLKKANISVDVANNGLEAISMIQKSKYDALLMDCQMPVMDGYEASTKIREIPNDTISKLPIIAMTANAMQGDKEKCISFGMDDYIPKPIDINKMFYTLSKWIKTSELKESKENIKEENISIDYKKYENLGLESKEAIGRMGDDEELYIKQLKRFSNSQKEFGKNIKQLFESSEQETLVRLAHTLKGLSGNIGAINIQEKAKKLEELFKQSLSNEAMELFNDIENDLKSVIEKIELFFSSKIKNENNTLNIISKKELKLKIEELKSLLNAFDTNAVDIFEQIKDTLKQMGYEKQSDMVEEKIENLEFDEALDIIENSFDFSFNE